MSGDGVDDVSSPKTGKKPLLKSNPKRNSTNSVWMTRTLSVGHPEVAELVKAMGLWVSALLHKVQDNPKEKPKYPQRNYAIFLDEDESLQPDDPLPSVDEITYFVGSIVGVGELAPQSCIMAIAYLSRIRPKLHIHLLNWRRVVLSSLILGCKVWEEHPVFNTDFNELFPEMSGKLLGQLEKHLLNLLRFNVGLTGSEYAKYYFELRDMSPAAFAAHDNPLTDDEIQRLEERSSDAARWQPVARAPASSQSANYGAHQKKRGELVVEETPNDPSTLVKAASSKLGRWNKEPDESTADDSLALKDGGNEENEDDDDDDDDDDDGEGARDNGAGVGGGEEGVEDEEGSFSESQ